MEAAIQPGFLELLERAGAIPSRHGRGKWRCPDCGHPALSVNLDKQAFHCFYAGCGFSGGIGTLRNRLGICPEWIPKAEWLRQKRERERTRDAAQRLHEAVKARRFRLFDGLRILAGVEAGAHRAGPTEAAWNALAMVYSERPGIEAELDALESGSAADVFRVLTGNDGAGCNG